MIPRVSRDNKVLLALAIQRFLPKAYSSAASICLGHRFCTCNQLISKTNTNLVVFLLPFLLAEHPSLDCSAKASRGSSSSATLLLEPGPSAAQPPSTKQNCHVTASRVSQECHLNYANAAMGGCGERKCSVPEKVSLWNEFFLKYNRVIWSKITSQRQDKGYEWVLFVLAVLI